MVINHLVIILLAALICNNYEPCSESEISSISTNTSRESVPYIVNLIYDKQHYCSGSYIKPLWILTTAHCVRRNWLPHTIVKMGDPQSNKTNTERKVRIAIQHALTPHNDTEERRSVNALRTMQARNNVGLLKINHPFPLSETIQIINIATYTHQYAGRVALTAGWGKLCLADNFSKELVSLDVAIAHNDDYIIYRKPNVNRCLGDSGAPIVLDSKLIGIVVCGFSCGDLLGHMPNLFIEIYPHLKWIRNQTSEE